MNEIRFNSRPVQAENNSPDLQNNNQSEKPKIGGNKLKIIFQKIVLPIVILAIMAVVLFVFGPVVKNFITTKIFSSSTGQFSAVFLTNGQVYFGEIRDISRDEIILENVYYLQTNSDGTPNTDVQTLSQSFKLVKLGNELHGPTDELFVNRSQVVFYEYLRDDSSVVQSIKKQ